MTRYENDCVDCGLGGCAFCSLRRVKHYYCDSCGEEIIGEPYEIYGFEFHYGCAMEEYPEEFEDDEMWE